MAKRQPMAALRKLETLIRVNMPQEKLIEAENELSVLWETLMLGPEE